MTNVIVDAEGKRRSATEVVCTYCNNKFLKANRFLKKSVNHFCNKECCKLYARRDQKLVTLTCAYCKIDFTRSPSKLDNSKHGIYFCCREHKDFGQRIENGISQIWPDHYGTDTTQDYRSTAFRNFGKKCNCCGNDDFLVLEVHHKDRNRENNIVDNLEVLCANCHTRKHKMGL